MKWRILWTKAALKDAKKLSAAGLAQKAQGLLQVLEVDPFQNPPRYENLQGELAGQYSRRINIQHRLVHQIYEAEHAVKILRMWTHYE